MRITRDLPYVLVAICALITGARTNANEQTLNIAVASNFYLPLQVILSTQPHDFGVKLIAGSTGTLYAQVLNGAPFDVLLAADSERAMLLFEQGLAEPPRTYAIGKLALFPASDGMELDTQINSASIIAIANPRIAPFGKAASQVLAKLDTREQPKIVMGNNVSQAFQFVDSGSAQLGLVSESLLIHAFTASGDPRYQQYVIIDPAYHHSLRQQGVVLLRSQMPEQARQFIAFLLSEAVQTQLAELGYFVPKMVEPDE